MIIISIEAENSIIADTTDYEVPMLLQFFLFPKESIKFHPLHDFLSLDRRGEKYHDGSRLDLLD